MTRLSIVVPAYNVADYIGRTLHSILQQNSERLEVLVVDDGAKDNTAQVVQEVIDVSRAENIKLYRKQNGGVSSARNYGQARAIGEYVLFLDGDDYLADGFVEQFLRLTAEQKPDIVHWPYDQVDEQGALLVPYPYSMPANRLRTGVDVLSAILFERTTRIWTCSAAYRQQWLLQRGLAHTEGCRVGEDSEFIYKALSDAQEVLFADQLKTLYLQRASSVMSSYSIRKFDAVEAMERVGAAFEKCEKPELVQMAAHFTNFEILHYYAGSFRMCLQHLIQLEGLQGRTAVDRLNRDIDEAYPQMRERMGKLLRERRRGVKPDRLDVFRISPMLYFHLSQWSDRMRGFRQA